jgi:flagellar hook-associated protein 2
MAGSTVNTINSIIGSSQLPLIGLSSGQSASQASSLAISGLASGFNWQATVQQLANAERGPETLWQNQQTTLGQQNAAFTTIKNDLATLQADIKALQDPSLYGSSTAQAGDSTIASATAASGAALGTYNFNFSQLATAAQITGSSNISLALAPTGDLTTVTVGAAGFSTPVTSGTFTVNGAQVTIASTDSLQQVFDKIAAATNNSVTASYSPTTDKITLTGGTNQEIILGSATDTSNFLQVTQLFNNGTGSITSASTLGHVQMTATLANADSATAITDGGSGQGQFTINGVSISYNASTDNLVNVIDRINNSAAGVTASYDVADNRFVLTNKVTGDIGISLQDVTGNFLAATGLAGGQLEHGQNLLYSLNGGAQLISQSNTISPASSGINGLSVTAAAQGSTSVTVSSDSGKISNAIQQFVTDYNAAQKFISSQQAVTTAADGTVTPGTLTGDLTANRIADSLRSLSFTTGAGSAGTIASLGALGIQTNGQDNTLTLSDSNVLDGILAGNLEGVQAFFADPTNGMATQLNNYINNLTGPSGDLTNHQADLTQQSKNLGTQIANLETKIQSDVNLWTGEFQTMEQVQSQINQQLTYLSMQVANGSL